MDDIVIVEAAHHMRDGVGLANVGQELVAQAFALRRPGDKAGDVHKLHGGGDDFFRFDDFGQSILAWIGHRSEERRVGKEGRARWWPDNGKKKKGEEKTNEGEDKK